MVILATPQAQMVENIRRHTKHTTAHVMRSNLEGIQQDMSHFQQQKLLTAHGWSCLTLLPSGLALQSAVRLQPQQLLRPLPEPSAQLQPTAADELRQLHLQFPSVQIGPLHLVASLPLESRAR